MLAESQIDFDIINQDALATDLKAGPGDLESMSGNPYRTVIIPSAMVLSQTELDRLKAFAKGSAAARSSSSAALRPSSPAGPSSTPAQQRPPTSPSPP